MYKIMIVEDDPTIARLIQKHLESWDYEVYAARDFSEVTAEFVREAPQLVLLDITLPFYNGYHWCREIRRISHVPIVFLSSASDNMNIVMAVNMGADDFIAKPFDLDVLTVKLQAVLRRSYAFAEKSEYLEYGGAVLHIAEAALSVGDKRIELSKNEFRILQVLMESRGRVVPRDTLMTRLWESDSFVDENTLSVNVNRLRKKLESVDLHDFIVTRKGIGYQLGQGEE